MPKIQIEIKDKIAINKNPEIKVVCDNSDYEVEFVFDEQWSGIEIKTARVYYNFSCIDIPFGSNENNTIKLPTIYNAQLINIGVFADNIKTSTDAQIECLPSIKRFCGNPPAPTQNVYDQIIELLNKYIEGVGGGEKPQSPIIFDENFPNSISDETYKEIHNRLLSGDTQIIIKGISRQDNTENVKYGIVYKYELTHYNDAGNSIYMYSLYLVIDSLGYFTAFDYNPFDKTISINFELEKLQTELEQTIPNVEVVTIGNFPDSFDFHDSVSLGDLFDGIDETGTQGTPPAIVILQNPGGSKKGVVISYERDEFPRAKVLVGDYIYTYILGGFADPNIGWFKKEPISIDTQIDGESIVEDGVANIPIAQAQLNYIVHSIGLVKLGHIDLMGLWTNEEGILCIASASKAQIDGRSTPRPITPPILDYAVKVGVTTNKETLTEEEQQSAQDWLGVKKVYKHTLWLTDYNISRSFTFVAYSTRATSITLTEIDVLNDVFKYAVSIDDANGGGAFQWYNLSMAGEQLQLTVRGSTSEFTFDFDATTNTYYGHSFTNMTIEELLDINVDIITGTEVTEI